MVHVIYPTVVLPYTDRFWLVRLDSASKSSDTEAQRYPSQTLSVSCPYNVDYWQSVERSIDSMKFPQDDPP